MDETTDELTERLSRLEKRVAELEEILDVRLRAVEEAVQDVNRRLDALDAEGRSARPTPGSVEQEP